MEGQHRQRMEGSQGVGLRSQADRPWEVIVESLVALVALGNLAA